MTQALAIRVLIPRTLMALWVCVLMGLGMAHADNCRQGAPTPTYPPGGGCDQGAPPCPESSTDGSLIDWRTLVHVHDAIDYQIHDIETSCSSCAGSSSSDVKNPLKDLKIQRYHRQRSMDVGSLGQDGYLLMDTQVYLEQFNGNKLILRYFDPAFGIIKIYFYDLYQTIDTTKDGILHDEALVFKEARLLDVNKQLITDLTNDTTVTPNLPYWAKAVWLEVVKKDNTRQLFALMNTDPTGSAAVTRSGRLVSITDPNGNAWNINYTYPVNASDATLGYDRMRLWMATRLTDHFGRFATFTYDNTTKRGGRFPVTGIALPNGANLVYSYTGEQMTRVDHPNGIAYSLITYGTGISAETPTMPKLTSVTYLDPTAVGGGMHTSKTVWFSMAANDAEGQIRRLECPTGNWDNTRFLMFWDQDVIDGSVSYVYDATKGMTRLTTEKWGSYILESAKATSFDLATDYHTWTFAPATKYPGNTPSNLPPSEIKPDGVTKTYTYDSQLRKVTGTVTNPGPNQTTTSATYNAFAQPLTVTDELGRVTTYTYDVKGNRLSKTVGTGSERSTWSWEYKPNGQMMYSFENDNRTDYIYGTTGNDKDRLITILKPADVLNGDRPQQSFTYDSLGRLASSTVLTDSGSIVTTYAYDILNRLTTTAYPADGSSETITYLPTGNTEAYWIKSKADRNGNVIYYDKDSEGRLVSTYRGYLSDKDEYIQYLPGTSMITWHNKYGEKSIKRYDARRRLVGEDKYCDANKVLSTQYNYDDNGEKISETDPYGRNTYFVYDVWHRVVRQIRELVPGGVPAGSILPTLARSTAANPPFVIVDYYYDLAGQRTGERDGRNILTSHTYDSQGRLKSTTVAAGTADAATTTYAYDESGNLISQVNPRGFTTTWTYSKRNLKLSETVAEGRPEAATRSWTYTRTGKQKTATDFRGKVTTFNYGGCCDRLVKVVDHLGGETSYGYDSNGNVLSVTDANGLTNSKTYDDRNRVITMTNGLGKTTNISYIDDITGNYSYANGLNFIYGSVGSNGSAVQVYNPLNQMERVTLYDGLGRTIREIDGNDNRTTYTYDVIETGNTNLVATIVTNPSNDLTTSYADGAGLVRKSKDAESRISTFTYDANGNRLTRLDPNGVGQTVTYDQRNRAVATSDTATGGLHTNTSTVYDANNNITRQVDGLGGATTFIYDARDRKTSSTDPLLVTTVFTYDANGNLLTIVDGDADSLRPAADRTTTYTYDDRNLLIKESYPPGQQTMTPGTDVRTYTYDSGRRLVSRTDQAGVMTTYLYDNANRLIQRQYPDALNDVFTYDDANRLTNAFSKRYQTTVARIYDAGSRLTKETQTVDGQNFVVSYAYNTASRNVTVTYPGGKKSIRTLTKRGLLSAVTYDGKSVATRTYDVGGRLTKTVYGNGLIEDRTYQALDNAISSIKVAGVTDFAYTFDANKRKLSEIDNIDLIRNQAFGYDAANRLISWQRDGQESRTWTLSEVGDWLSASTTNIPTGAVTTETRTHSGVHEALSTTINGVKKNLAYDAKGNLTKDESGKGFLWDVENRMSASKNQASDAGLYATFIYDALGRRLAKRSLNSSVIYPHDGAQAIQEWTGSTYSYLDIGAVGLAGSATWSSAKLTMKAAGKPLTGTADALGYHYRYLDGDGSVTVQMLTLANTSADTRAVLMVRDASTDASTVGARFVAITQSPTGALAKLVRSAANAALTTPSSNAGTGVMRWLRITRTGQLFSTQHSLDGVTWTTLGTNTSLTLPKRLLVGVGVTSGVTTTLTTSECTNLSVSGASAPPVVGQLVNSIVHGSYVDEVLAFVQVSGTTAVRYYCHSNHLYSPAALTDATKTVVERYRYDAYGKRTVMDKGGVDRTTGTAYGFGRGFTGYQEVAELGAGTYYYARARIYSAELGRFVGRDEDYVDGYQLYSAYFVPNHLDPTGENFISDTWDDVRGGIKSAWRGIAGGLMGFIAQVTTVAEASARIAAKAATATADKAKSAANLLEANGKRGLSKASDQVRREGGRVMAGVKDFGKKGLREIGAGVVGYGITPLYAMVIGGVSIVTGIEFLRRGFDPDEEVCHGVYNRWPGVDFRDACSAHNKCYSACDGPSRGECDDKFLRDMQSACRNGPWWASAGPCLAGAYEYYLGARAFGGDMFDKSRSNCNRASSSRK